MVNNNGGGGVRNGHGWGDQDKSERKVISPCQASFQPPLPSSLCQTVALASSKD